MPPFRLPFTSRKTPNGAGPVSDENARPGSQGTEVSSPYSKDKPSLALNVKERKQEPNEFKLSSVNDSGEFEPPSPTEKNAFKSKTSSTNPVRPGALSEHEPFSISRESFDSYRRSFDISGRSPIIHQDSYTSRTSFDSRFSPRSFSRQAVNETTFERLPGAVEEDRFEEVGLSDDQVKTQPKKKGIFSSFRSDADQTPTGDAKSHHFSFTGRKRGQSGTGNELGDFSNVNRPSSKGQAEGLKVT